MSRLIKGVKNYSIKWLRGIPSHLLAFFQKYLISKLEEIYLKSLWMNLLYTMRLYLEAKNMDFPLSTDKKVSKS
jgi:hypothetical protein